MVVYQWPMIRKTGEAAERSPSENQTAITNSDEQEHKSSFPTSLNRQHSDTTQKHLMHRHTLTSVIDSIIFKVPLHQGVLGSNTFPPSAW